MANTVKSLDAFKRGDTPTFRFEFTNPYSGFDWSGVSLDAAMTSASAPNDNTGAGATRLNEALSISTTGAYYEFTLTITESKALTPNTDYFIEAQLKSGALTVTPVTVKVKVLQDYVI